MTEPAAWIQDFDRAVEGGAVCGALASGSCCTPNCEVCQERPFVPSASDLGSAWTAMLRGIVDGALKTWQAVR